MTELTPQSLGAPQPSRITEDMCQMALKSLMLAMRSNMRRLKTAEKELHNIYEERIRNLQALRRRRAGTALIGRKGDVSGDVRAIVDTYRTKRDEIQTEMTSRLRKLDEFRGLFAQQIEDTVSSGFPELSEKWARRFANVETPFDEEFSAVPERERAAYMKERINIGKIWRDVRESIKQALEGGGKAVPALVESLKGMGQRTFPAPALAHA